MNTAEKYIYTVYQTGSFSKAAEKMFVSQPALSRAIKIHETKLGYEIFNRKTSPFTLTPKGTVYIEYLEEMNLLEQQLEFRISTLSNPLSKKLSIGGNNSTSHIILPVLCKEFSKRFPDVDIKINQGASISGILFSNFEKGSVDILITTHHISPKYKSEVLWREKYMIVIRKDYPGIEKLQKYSLSYNEVLTGVYPVEKEITDWSLFKNINVFKMGRNLPIRKNFSEFFKNTAHESLQITNFYRMDLHYRFMLEGLGATMIPQSVIIDNGYDTDVLCCFSLALPGNVRESMLVYKDDENTSPYVKEFISLSREIYGGNITPARL